MCICSDTIPECDRQMDGQMSNIALCVHSMLTYDKNVAETAEY